MRHLHPPDARLHLWAGHRFERQLGPFDPNVYKALAVGGDVETGKAKIEAMAGSSGFMLFGTNDHGSLLRLAGQKRKACHLRPSLLSSMRPIRRSTR